MKILINKFITLCFLFLASTVLGQEITLSSNKIIYDLYSEWQYSYPAKEINNFSSMTVHRGEIELALISIALYRGGLDHNIKLISLPNYSRALEQAKLGKSAMPVETVWDADIDYDLFYVSDPILEFGSVELGVYVRPNNNKILKVRSLSELQNYKAISNHNWVKNWSTLEEMQCKKHSVPKQATMFKFVATGRADFILNEFSAEDDLSVTIDGHRLIPVPDIKVGIKGSRHFVVSKKHPLGKEIYNALQKGIKEMRADGTIQRAYTEAGFFNPKTKNWKKIFPVEN